MVAGRLSIEPERSDFRLLVFDGRLPRVDRRGTNLDFRWAFVVHAARPEAPVPGCLARLLCPPTRPDHYGRQVVLETHCPLLLPAGRSWVWRGRARRAAAG